MVNFSGSRISQGSVRSTVTKGKEVEQKNFKREEKNALGKWENGLSGSNISNLSSVSNMNKTNNSKGTYNVNNKKNSNNVNSTEQASSNFNKIIPEDYQKIKYTVINENLLLDQIRKYNKIRRDTIEEEFYYARILSLSNKNILVIQNLDLFKTLEELCIDNNAIETLENLSCLKHLKKLSASNNKITKIQNLEGLTELTELNLHNNRITQIENLEKNRALSVLTLSKNRIHDLNSLVHLANLSKLTHLNLTDNPICDIKNFKVEAMKHLKHVQYINNAVNSACHDKNRGRTKETKYFPKPLLLYPNETDVTPPPDTLDPGRESYMKKLTEAFITELPHVPDLLFDQHTEPACLQKLHNYPQIKNKYLKELSELTSQTIQRILELNVDRRESLETFKNSLRDILKKNMEFHISEYKHVKRIAKTVIRNILGFVEASGDKNVSVSIVEYPYQKNDDINNNIILEDMIKKKLQLISKNRKKKSIEIVEDELLGICKSTIDRNQSKLEQCEQKNSSEPMENKTKRYSLEQEKYEVLKNYFDKHIKNNYLFGKKLINEELKNMAALNNFIEGFKNNISKIIKIIVDNLSDYFKKIEQLEHLFTTKIIEYMSNATQSTNANVQIATFSEEELNEFYLFRGHRLNLLNSTEESISNNYNTSFNELIDETKKDVFAKSRDRILQIRQIVADQNNLLYSYFSEVQCIQESEIKENEKKSSTKIDKQININKNNNKMNIS